MCVILYSVRALDGAELAAAIRRNPDGLAWSTWDGEGWTCPHKAAPAEGDGEAYLKEAARLSLDGLPAGSVFWARIATGSRCDLRNCQPFPICRGCGWLWHNGIVGESSPAESDTRRLGAILADTTPARAEWLLEVLARSGAGRFLVLWQGNPAPAVFGRWNADEDGDTIRSNRAHLWKPRRDVFAEWDAWTRDTAAADTVARHGGGRFVGDVIRGLEWRRE
jgi:hypothetical protein